MTDIRQAEIGLKARPTIKLTNHRCGQSVDRKPATGQRKGVMAKPRKVEEPVTPYTATLKSPVKASAPADKKNDVDEATFHRVVDKIFTERKELLRKLAQ